MCLHTCLKHARTHTRSRCRQMRPSIVVRTGAHVHGIVQLGQSNRLSRWGRIWYATMSANLLLHIHYLATVRNGANDARRRLILMCCWLRLWLCALLFFFILLSMAGGGVECPLRFGEYDWSILILSYWTWAWVASKHWPTRWPNYDIFSTRSPTKVQC